MLFFIIYGIYIRHGFANGAVGKMRGIPPALGIDSWFIPLQANYDINHSIISSSELLNMMMHKLVYQLLFLSSSSSLDMLNMHSVGLHHILHKWYAWRT